MKHLTRTISILLLVSLLLAAPALAAGAAGPAAPAADALNSLSLFYGYGNDASGNPDYGLADGLTREQGVLLMLRMLGKIDEAKQCGLTHPFTDVKNPDYDVYVAYAYSSGLIAGMSETEFGFAAPMNAQMFLTLCLRALGYENAWANAFTLAAEAGLTAGIAEEKTFSRGSAAAIFWNALAAPLKDGGATLADRLIEAGVFSAEQYASAQEIHAAEAGEAPAADPGTSAGGSGGGSGAGSNGTGGGAGSGSAAADPGDSGSRDPAPGHDYWETDFIEG